jgi:GNAT superfamily N-acetyltransferase
MLLRIVPVVTDAYRGEIRELFEEYLSFLQPLYKREFDVSFDVHSLLERSMVELDRFMPPHGHILLAYADTRLAGCVCLRTISKELGEIKRMYVRSEQRGKGIGRALVEAIIAEARADGFTRLRLDTAPFLPEAQRLYRSVGFTPTPPYADSEIPARFHSRCIFMELHLGTPEKE